MKEVYRVNSTLFLFFVFFSSQGLAQQIENLSSAFDGTKLTVSYDLVYPDTSRRFTVELLNSLDGYGKGLAPVAGAVGEKIKPGKGLKIVWEPRKALPVDFDSEIVFKVRSTIIPLPVVVEKKEPIQASSKLTLLTVFKSSYRRGKSISIKWNGGKPDDRIVAELIDASGKKETLQTTANNKGELVALLPGKQKTGKDYILRITPGGRSNDAALSPTFSIHYKTPLVVKVLPIIAVGLILIPGKKSSGDATLPSPISPN